MLIRYINPDKAHCRRACFLHCDIEKDIYFDGNVYARFKPHAVHFRANTRARRVFAELKREDRAWRRRCRG